MTGTTKYYTYTAAVAFIQNAGCGGNVTGVDIIADGDQAAGTSDTITGITYGSETVVSGPVTTYAGTIRLHKPGLCLDDRLNSRTPSAAVQVWRCNGLASQQWQVMSDGTIRHNGLCLDARASGTANGVRIQLWSCTGAANQQWDTRGWRVHYDNPAASRKVLDDSASGGPGTQQEIYTNTGGANQVWATS
ncbi:MAG TPA: RICIN domain-containing protein [Streptosporangiaceae bacterium]|nr:RICIN domain-containing protein [Streptosporangiaceae bacterium]